MGNPDVIILHGGTNDCSNRGKSIALYPDYPTYGGTNYNDSACPTEAQIKTMCDNAAALTTRDAILKLNDTTFVEAYIKLLCLMHQQYPNAKVVMVIGDKIHAGTRLAIQRIANNYASKWGYRCVNLQDTECGTIAKLDGDNTHPSEAGHETMAKYIYTKVGTYIDPAN
jgi:lysophospholipase L1-like esterase